MPFTREIVFPQRKKKGKQPNIIKGKGSIFGIICSYHSEEGEKKISGKRERIRQ